jgi:hypothetical protein
MSCLREMPRLGSIDPFLSPLPDGQTIRKSRNLQPADNGPFVGGANRGPEAIEK